MAGTAGAASIILVLAGAVFLLVEIFFFPGFGVAGITGAVLVVAGLVAARIPEGFGGGGGVTPPEVRWETLGAAVAPVFIGLGMGAVGIAVLMRYFPRMPILNRLVLTSDLGGAVVTAAGAAGLERPEQLMGRSGVAATNLRPGGSARFDGKLLDVISDSEWLEVGTPVKIVSADSNRIIVRRA
jgi:membrane-bound serine protease (ClpP class)